MKKTIVVLFGFALCDTACFAGGGNNVSKLTSAWGNGKLQECQSHALTSTNACIGATQNCENRKMYARQYTDEWAVQMMVAMDINENGARFCPVQIEGKNKNKGDAWTEYAELGTSNCVWLCKNGYTGERCSAVADDSTSCDVTELKAANYSDIKRLASGANAEDRVPMFAFNKYFSCGVHKKQEHDMILAISRWTPSGHGAIVQQMVVRAEREGWDKMKSWATIYPASGAEELLVCKNGYKANSAGTDCEAINKETCARSMACNGWGDFDSAQHALLLRDGENCYEYRCNKSGQAFQSAINHTCTECTEDLRGGVNPATGECVKCAAGKMFNTNASNTGYCSDTTAYSRTDMQYGKSQTKNTNSDVNNQCWILNTPEEYIKCVAQGGINPKK